MYYATRTMLLSNVIVYLILQANNYNVEISCPGRLDEGMDKMALKLLSTKRHHEELADYQAPSLGPNQ